MAGNNIIEEIEIERLRLDPGNPRLPESIARDQLSMLDYIAESTSIEDLMGAIAENDFFPGEPLIVIPDKADSNNSVVVEGNRRLTAVKLLHNPDHTTNPSSRMRDISKTAKHKPNKLPVVRRATREEVIPYLGFRHITGVKSWEPLAKARYIKQLFDITNNKDHPNSRYREVARAVGSGNRTDHIKTYLDALAIYRIIESHNFFGIKGLNEETIKFSILSTALTYERIGFFVGLLSKDYNGYYATLDPIIDPSIIKVRETQELIEWLYKKDESGRVRIGESRRLRELAAIVDNPKALSAFRDGASLTYAYQLTSDVGKDFLGLLYQAEGALIEAAGMVATMNYDEQSVQVSRRIIETIRMIGKTLNEKRIPDDDVF